MKVESIERRREVVLDYVRSTEGRRRIRGLMFGQGYSYQRALAVVVLEQTSTRLYSEIEALVDEVMLEELATEGMPA